MFRNKRPRATVIVSADHGEEFADHGGWYHGTTLYDEQVRVPFLWSSPGVVQAGTVQAPVEILDITTTLLAAVGIPRDARMRGDDLGPFLRAEPALGPMYAFASVGDEQMAVNEQHKAICSPLGCRLYDLKADPQEQYNLASAQPEIVASMQTAISSFRASIPRIEAMGVGGGQWPEPLARVQLGEEGAVPLLVPLLADSRYEVRAQAARMLGLFRYRPAVQTLATMRDMDQHPDVQAEAAIAGLWLDDSEAREKVAEIVSSSEQERSRRAALALASVGDARGEEIIKSLVGDEQADEELRIQAMRAAARLRISDAHEILHSVLNNVRLRPDAIDVLAELGGKRSADMIAEALLEERYLPAREAGMRALFSLNDSRAVPLTLRFLGMDTPVPGGVELLVEHQPRKLAYLAGIDSSSIKERGQWNCEAGGCTPGDAAELEVVPEEISHPMRAVWWVRGPGILRVNGQAFEIAASTQISVDVDGPLRWQVQGDVAIAAIVLVPASNEVPPPAPEPWE